ncbi:hypothetical protein BD779DRAFT_309245 [Infundibulicybe gibba]|nr:hypothetical protein BD779DRAFT_309245 [Infundibulicybe gibba]
MPACQQHLPMAITRHLSPDVNSYQRTIHHFIYHHRNNSALRHAQRWPTQYGPPPLCSCGRSIEKRIYLEYHIASGARVGVSPRLPPSTSPLVPTATTSYTISSVLLPESGGIVLASGPYLGVPVKKAGWRPLPHTEERKYLECHIVSGDTTDTKRGVTLSTLL